MVVDGSTRFSRGGTYGVLESRYVDLRRVRWKVSYHRIGYPRNVPRVRVDSRNANRYSGWVAGRSTSSSRTASSTSLRTRRRYSAAARGRRFYFISNLLCHLALFFPSLDFPIFPTYSIVLDFSLALSRRARRGACVCTRLRAAQAGRRGVLLRRLRLPQGSVAQSH